MNIRNENGITLPALIVTVVVMVILAAIAVSASVGDNGVVTKTKESTIKASIREVEEALDAYIMLKEKELIKNGNFNSVTIESLIDIVTPETTGVYIINSSGLAKLNIKGNYGKGTKFDVFKIKSPEVLLSTQKLILCTSPQALISLST